MFLPPPHTRRAAPLAPQKRQERQVQHLPRKRQVHHRRHVPRPSPCWPKPSPTSLGASSSRVHASCPVAAGKLLVAAPLTPARRPPARRASPSAPHLPHGQLLHSQIPTASSSSSSSAASRGTAGSTASRWCQPPPPRPAPPPVATATGTTGTGAKLRGSVIVYCDQVMLLS